MLSSIVFLIPSGLTSRILNLYWNKWEQNLYWTKWEPVMLNEAKTSRPRPRPRPELRGRGQDYKAEAEAKNNYEKVPNND